MLNFVIVVGFARLIMAHVAAELTFQPTISFLVAFEIERWSYALSGHFSHDAPDHVAYYLASRKIQSRKLSAAKKTLVFFKISECHTMIGLAGRPTLLVRFPEEDSRRHKRSPPSLARDLNLEPLLVCARYVI